MHLNKLLLLFLLIASFHACTSVCLQLFHLRLSSLKAKGITSSPALAGFPLAPGVMEGDAKRSMLVSKLRLKIRC